MMSQSTPPEPSTPNPSEARKKQQTPSPPQLLGSGCLVQWLAWTLILLLFWGALSLLLGGSGSGSSSTCTLPFGSFYQQLQAGQIKNITIQGDQATGDLKQAMTCPGDSSTKTTSFQTTIPLDDQTLQAELDSQVQTHALSYTVTSTNTNIWLTLLIDVGPWLLFGVLMFWLLRRRSPSQQGIFNFGKSKARQVLEDRPSTTFADVAGIDEAKEELQEVVEFLKTPEKYQRLGGKIPRGVLLVGPPGTGKTLLGRAVAGEAGVPFFSISGSEFVEMLVGVGASRVRDLFEQAKKHAPCIIFLDEIDAVGRQRGTSLVTNDEREQTLNQLLVEMDGFEQNQAIVVIAATNRPDGLDPALLRAGRFDRRVTVDRPDWKGRLEILEIHTRLVPLSVDVDLLSLARMTPGMVGADLANLVNEAALLAARRNLERVDMACFTQALDKIQLGAERPLVLSEDDLRVVAYHEGGHALVGLLTPDADPVTKVTIVPRGQTLGVTQSTPLDDRYNYSKVYLLARMQVTLGGRAAEEVALGTITTGAENDLQMVTRIARQMVTRWGMSEQIGLVSLTQEQNPFLEGGREELMPQAYSEETARKIDEAVHTLVVGAYEQVKQVLREHRYTLERIAQELRRREFLDARQLTALLAETGVNASALDPGEGAPPTTLAVNALSS